MRSVGVERWRGAYLQSVVPLKHALEHAKMPYSTQNEVLRGLREVEVCLRAHEDAVQHTE